ncbi:kinase-like protein, partial [Auricularia subglabra TFB-10046 SS5]
HPRVLPFLGAVDVAPQQALVSIYMRNGNLVQYLQLHRDCDKQKMIVQVAEAIDYLHTVKRLVHGDIKCSNVLVSDSGDALLGDFGLSTLVEKSELDPTTLSSIRDMNTTRFAAPELLLGANNPNIKPRSKTRESDVYAFGMLVLEVRLYRHAVSIVVRLSLCSNRYKAITEQLPWSSENNLSVVQKVCSAQIPPRPTLDGVTLMGDAWWETCQRCWSFEPGNRPPMNLVLKTLKLSHHPLVHPDSAPIEDPDVSLCENEQRFRL